jgi:hypothetical protein
VLTKEQLKYLAGIVDANGNVDITFHSQVNGIRPVPKLTIMIKFSEDLEVIVKEISEYGVVYKEENNYHVFESDHGRCFELLGLISPHLVFKKKQVDFVLSHSLDEKLTTEEADLILEEYKVLECEVSEVEMNNRWLSGFIDGKGQFVCELHKNHRQKLSFRIVISFDNNIWLSRFNKVVKTYGGYIKDVNNGLGGQYVLDLTSGNKEFLLELANNMRVKRYHAMIAFYWLEIEGKGNWSKSGIEMKLAIVNLMDRLKLVPFGFDTYQLIAPVSLVFAARKPLHRRCLVTKRTRL